MKIEKLPSLFLSCEDDEREAIISNKNKINEIIDILNATNCLQSIPHVIGYRVEIKDKKNEN